MTTVTTHVLDTSRGVPARGITIRLYALGTSGSSLLGEWITNADGRTDTPLARGLPTGTYEIVFAAGPYFARHGTAAFYADIPIRFTLAGDEHYHVPLLLSPWSYATYRGS